MMHKKVATKQGLGSLLDMVCGNVSKHSTRRRSRWPRYQNDHLRHVSHAATPETLERRFAFDVAAFAAAGQDQVTLVVSEGDDLYLTQVTSSPQNLLYGTSSSYLGDEFNAGVISDFDSYPKFMIAEGNTINESVIRADGSPAWGVIRDTETFFLPKHVPHYSANYPVWELSGPPDNDVVYRKEGGPLVSTETRGRIEVTQPDGALSTWTFTNWNQETASIRFDNQNISIVEGANYGGQGRMFSASVAPQFEAITPGYYYPVGIAAEYEGAITNGPTPTGFRVVWNQPLTQSTNPQLIFDQYYTESRTQITAERILPAAFAVESPPPQGPDNFYQVTYTLGEAEGNGLVPGALSGKVSILPYGILGEVEFIGTDINRTGIDSDYEGTYALQFKKADGSFTDGNIAETRVFDNENVGQQSSLRNFSGDDRNVIPGPGGLEPIQIDGFYNTKQGTITLRFRQAYQTTDGRIAGAIGAKPGRVELQDVRYAVYEAATQGNSGQQASRVFIEPGLNIEASLTVELQSPGAALYVNNPISATGNEPLFESPVTEGAIALRASEIYLNADIQAQQRIDIGSTTEVAQKTGAGLESPTGTTLALYRDPKAIINVQGARIQAISPVLGHEGSGYTPGYRPKVAISRPVEAQAEISAGRLVGGLADLGIGNKGAGYTQFGGGNGTTQLTISPPELLGWDENNDGVIDYPAVQATATATFVGGVVQGITITNPGFGYVSPPTVTLPAPARKEEKNTQTGEVTFSPIQAVVAVQYGGVLESLSVDDGGYNYNPQAEGFSTPSLDPQDPGYIPQPNPLPETKVLLTAKNAQGLPTDSFEIYPLVGDQRFIARALLPDGGLKGDVVLTANDSDGDGENDETIITGAYTWLADVGANGELDPLFDIAVDGPPALDPLSVPRPYIQAQVGASGRIDEYDIQTRGQGYGVVPGYKVQLSGLPEEPGTVVARTAQGQVSLVAERPDIIFEIAKNTDSFLDGDDLDGHADNQEVASMEIIFKNETLTEQPDEVTGEFDSSVWQSVDPSAYAEADVGALFKNSVKRTIVLQKPEVQDPGNPLGNFATNSFEIDASSINDKLDYFDGELFGIGDASLDLLAADYESAEDLEKIELLRNDFGQEYRLVVKKTQVLTYVQPDGTIVELDGGDQPDDEYQSIGKAYLGTGYGYQSVPVVQVQRPSAENAPAEFTVVLDGEGRIKDFEINSPGNGYEEGVEYVVAVSALKNPQTTEIVEFNSTISAPHYDIRVADDVRDDARLKGEVFVSPLSVIGNGGSPSDSVYIEADTTDVYVAGGINADTQSYVFQSPIYRQLDGPFTFSTRNRDTGLSSGLLAGETLTLAFGAETSDFDPNGSIITHVVDVDTDLLVQVNPTLNNAGSLRVTAGADGTDSFPVDINVRDIGSLDVDSNIRSSGEVAITAASSLNVNAAINTDGDLALTGGLSAGRVSLSGPLTSTRGSISLQGGTLDVRADVVAEGQGDVGDILLRATGGDVNVSGAVRTGDNGNIRIEQSAASVVAGSFDSVVTKTTGDGDTAKTTTSKVLNLPINNTITTTASLTVGTAPANFDRITVSLDIDHTYVGDLTGLVTAPSGERITLFSRNGGSSDDYDNVTFDSLAIRSLSSSQPPFSGEYRPIDVISTPSNTEGVWTLSITDAFSGDSGTLNAFSIRFIGADGEVEVGEAGSVKGVGILESEQIVVQALGSVGAASGGLSELLKTKSSSVSVYSATGSVGLRSLQAGQFQVDAPAAVAISSLGTDVVGRFGELTPALQVDIRNARSVAFEAPDGSIRADIESPSTVEITGFGNGISPVAAGSVDIRVVDSDVVVRDAPIGGEGVVNVDKVVKFTDLGNAQMYGDVEGYVAGRIEGQGILDGSYTAGEKVLIVGDQAGTNLPAVSLVMDQLGQEFDGSVGRVNIVDGGSGYTAFATDVGVTFAAAPFGGTRATGQGVVDENGVLVRVEITDPGSGYTAPPTLTIDPPPISVSGGSTATAVTGYYVTVAGERVKRLDESGNSIDVMTTEYAGWAPVVAGEYSGKREIVWGYKDSPAADVSMITVWTLALDSTWSGAETLYRSTDFGFMEVERRYQNDIDNDGSIGLTLIENDGSVRLELADDQQPVVDGYGVTINGDPVYQTNDWSPVAAETIDGKNIIAWQNQGEAGRFLLWVCNNNWERVEGLAVPPAGTLQHGQFEVSLDLDLNADGVKGILNGGGLRSNLVAISEGGIVFVNGNAVTKNGEDVAADGYPGWRVLSAAEEAGQLTLLWGHASGRVAEWNLDSSTSAYVSDGVIPTPGVEPAFSEFEEKYQVSLSGAGFWSLMPTQTITAPPVEVMKAYAPELYTGVYEVVSTGGMSQNWRLVRSVDFNTSSEFADRLMIHDMSEDKYLQVERLAGQIGSNSNSVSSRAYEVSKPETKITTALDKNMTYVVSQNNGDNQTTGSLGRVISLIEQNAIGDRLVNIGFSEIVSTITPTQELPEITRSLNVDGSKRWVTSNGVSQMIDVVFDENGNPSSAIGTSAGLQPVGLSGSRIVVDRTGNPVSVFSESPIDGLVLTGVVGDQGEGQNLSQIAGIKNIEIGGFGDGAGILIEESDNVFIDGVVLGAGGLANLSGNDVGIRIAGSRDVTMNEVQVSSNNVGLLVEDGDVLDAFGSEKYVSDSNRVIGTHFTDNEVGARLGGTGSVEFGVGPVFVQPLVAFKRGDTQIAIENSDSNAELWRQMHVGMAVTGENLPVGTRIVGIDYGRHTIEISQAALNTVFIDDPVQLTFGEPWQITDTASKAFSAQLNEGSPRVVLSPSDFVTVAAGREINYGTPVFGDGIAPGTFVLALDENTQEVVLSRPAVTSTVFGAVTQVGFAVGNDGRNILEGGSVGIEISDGQHTLVRNTIRNNDVGILVSGSYEDGVGHDVGLSSSRAAGFANIIEDNSKFGVLVFESVSDNGNPEEDEDGTPGTKGGTRIAGNVFQSLGAAPNAAGNIGRRTFQFGRITDAVFGGFESDEYTPDLETSLDGRGNLHKSFLPGPGANSLAPPTILPIDGGVIRVPRPTILGTAYDNAEITLYANGDIKGTTFADENGDWSIELTTDLTNGTYSFTADATDIQGVKSAQSAPVVATVVLDDVPPSPGEIEITTSVITTPTPIIIGRCEPECLVTLLFNGATYQVSSDVSGDWSVDTSVLVPILGTLQEFVHNSNYSVSVTVQDLAGNVTGPISGMILYDNEPVVPPPPQPPRRPVAEGS